jgi:hypothetical protein
MAKLKLVKILFHLLLFIGIPLFGSTLVVNAQPGSDNSSPLIPQLGKEAPAASGPEAEFYHRAAIQRQVAAHKEMLERAQENTRLGAQLVAEVGKDSRSLGLDLKKLELMEKLARKIRGGSGGSEDVDVLQNPPQDLAAAIHLLDEKSQQLLKEVEKTSRLVTSATVIECSNEIIQLVRHVKSLVRQ